MGRFALVWMLVTFGLPLAFGLWPLLPFALALGLLTAAVQVPVLMGLHGLATLWPRMSYRLAVAVFAGVLTLVLFASVAGRLLVVPVFLVYPIHLVAAREPHPSRQARRGTQDCPVCAGPARMDRVVAAPAREGGGLRAVYLCTPHQHESRRGVDGAGPLRPLDAVGIAAPKAGADPAGTAALAGLRVAVEPEA
ncbi:hypothetical protein [Streptacidiphilus sp. MAP12-33]|uniref:hypothetical protein n=1 Tax=Streptacidiphilus sp. MAP12-33 TaxID=3156266 RepID=UPI0035143A50